MELVELQETLLASVKDAGWEFPDDWNNYDDRKQLLWMNKRAGLTPPPGWSNYDYGQKRDWLEHQRKRRFQLLKMRALVEKRLAQEKNLKLPPINSFELAKDADPEKPKYVVRCVYGPLRGFALSRILALDYDPKFLQRRCRADNAIVGTAADSYQRGDQWGPKMFLWQLFSAVAELQGDCVIYFTHNEVEMRVVPEEFKEWVDRAQADPVKALTEPLKLLEG